MVKVLLEGMEKLLTPNGVFIAAPSEEYRACWIRDQLYTCFSYYYLGDFEKLKKGIWIVFDILQKHRPKLEKAICDFFHNCIHAKYTCDTLDEITHDWGHHQLDALGLFIYLIAYCDSKDIKVFRDRKDYELVDLLVYYLTTIRYWKEEDHGMWEDDEDIHSSSIGAVLAGLSCLEKRGITFIPLCAIKLGEESLNNLVPRESSMREVDMAQLSLIWPYDIISDKIADIILERVKGKLVQEHGLNRYLGDNYYKSDNRMSAEWPLGFFWLSIIASQRKNPTEAKYWFNKGLEQRTAEGYIPELYQNELPNKNTPLAWAHSLAIVAKTKLSNNKKG